MEEIHMTQKTASVAVLAIILSLAGAVSAEASNESRDERQAPTNGLIAFGRFDPSLNDFSLWVAEADGSHQRRLTEGPANFSDWSPDGSRIAFDYADESGVHIGTIAPDGSKRRALTDLPGIQEAPKWSPDGRSIVFDAFPFDQDTFSVSIWVMRSDGSQPRQLTQGAIDVEPVFSPDGTQIAFGRIVGDSAAGQLEAIYVMNSDGTGLRELVAARPALEHPDWSPDGRLITFNIAPESLEAPDSGAILAVRTNGHGLRVLHKPTTDLRFFKAVWSPDGRQMLTGCFDTRAEMDRICTIPPNGRARVVVAGDTPVNYPSWGPRTQFNR
jgi:Tol biopolymer transport system component